MTANNPLSGHTDGANDGLTDGDHILSPSLTNLYEGVHGNGILLPHDTAYGDSDRNDPPDLPGAISAGSAANNYLEIGHWGNGDLIKVYGDRVEIIEPLTLSSGTIEFGHASDTTISRVSAGVIAVEGKNLSTVDDATALAIALG